MKFALASLIILGFASSSTLITSGLTDAEKQTLLDTHNKLRNTVASGSQANQPQASNMKVMSWDSSLEQTAQAWANNMNFAHSGNDKGYGENLAIAYSSAELTYDPASDVQRWYDEVKDASWKPSYVDSYVFGSAYGHYSQVIWATSNKLGCGHAYYKNNNNQYTHLTVCQYKAQGNYLTQPVYAKGTPCSSCGTDTCNQKYTSLCGATADPPSNSGTPSTNTGTLGENNNTTFSFILTSLKYMQLLLITFTLMI